MPRPIRCAVGLIGLASALFMAACARSIATTSPPAEADSAPVATPPAARGLTPDPALLPPASALPDSFDLAAYRADPSAYCARTDATRVHAVAQPGPDVPALAAVGAGSFVVPTGGSARLMAQTAAGMPVTFTSQGLGVFPASGLSTVIVAADADGLAIAEFRISPGTVGHCLILAGSPVRAGTASYLVTVQE